MTSSTPLCLYPFASVRAVSISPLTEAQYVPRPAGNRVVNIQDGKDRLAISQAQGTQSKSPWSHDYSPVRAWTIPVSKFGSCSRGRLAATCEGISHEIEFWSFEQADEPGHAHESRYCRGMGENRVRKALSFLLRILSMILIVRSLLDTSGVLKVTFPFHDSCCLLAAHKLKYKYSWCCRRLMMRFVEGVCFSCSALEPVL